jgi:hypothetical protein
VQPSITSSVGQEARLRCDSGQETDGDDIRMLKAYLHHKVSRELVRREDIVTSCVFGTLEASGAEGFAIARRFLALARTRHATDADRAAHITSITYEFWPWLVSPLASAEPDLLLTVDHGSSRSLVAIEAKLDSGKSSAASNDGHVRDQLAREWVALLETAHQRGIPHCTLIYLTADVAFPPDINDSLAELAAKHPDLGNTPRILWLSWRDLPDLITPNHGISLQDMRRFLLEEHLGYFAGFHAPPRLPPPWRFADVKPVRSTPGWVWPSITSLPASFNFVPAAPTTFDWPSPVHPEPLWRFRP